MKSIEQLKADNHYICPLCKEEHKLYDDDFAIEKVKNRTIEKWKELRKRGVVTHEICEFYDVAICNNCKKKLNNLRIISSLWYLPVILLSLFLLYDWAKSEPEVPTLILCFFGILFLFDIGYILSYKTYEVIVKKLEAKNGGYVVNAMDAEDKYNAKIKEYISDNHD